MFLRWKNVKKYISKNCHNIFVAANNKIMKNFVIFFDFFVYFSLFLSKLCHCCPDSSGSAHFDDFLTNAYYGKRRQKVLALKNMFFANLCNLKSKKLFTVNIFKNCDFGQKNNNFFQSCYFFVLSFFMCALQIFFENRDFFFSRFLAVRGVNNVCRCGWFAAKHCRNVMSDGAFFRVHG